MKPADPKPDLAAFVESFVGEGHLRVEADLGYGFVRLRSSEAEWRQAIQDIRSSEDILIELLRNARDAHARQIFVAVARSGNIRRILVIDDGGGIPEALHEAVFEPRVTSKLDTGHLDKWGFHGRGMALFSISANARIARVVASSPDKGSAISVETDLEVLPEKADQSSFPTFIPSDTGAVALRGPKNLLRTAVEFSLEARDCDVYLGSFAEIAATLRVLSESRTTINDRLFHAESSSLPYWERLGVPQTAEGLTRASATIGIELSERTSRRILDGEIEPLPTILQQVSLALSQDDGSASPSSTEQNKRASSALPPTKRRKHLSFTTEDRDEFRQGVKDAYDALASRYYLDPSVEIDVSVSKGKLCIHIPLVDEEGER